jgi:hypothetical protein
MTMETDLTKVDLSKLLPPPGVPCRNEQERDLATALACAGVVKVEWGCAGRNWRGINGNRDNSDKPQNYRLAPQPPKRFERVTVEVKGAGWQEDDPREWITGKLEKIGQGKKALVTIVVEEVME